MVDCCMLVMQLVVCGTVAQSEGAYTFCQTGDKPMAPCEWEAIAASWRWSALWLLLLLVPPSYLHAGEDAPARSLIGVAQSMSMRVDECATDDGAA